MTTHTSPAPRPLTVLLAGVTLGTALLAAPSGAEPARPYETPYSVSVEDGRGAPLRTFWHDGQRFVLGAPGDRYVVRIENHSARRVEAVISIDGRDAVSGHVADYAHERGYLVSPHGSVVVEGFRKSTESVAAFRFGSPGASYSARMGTPENVGVLGVAFFAERPPPPPRPVWIPRPPMRWDAPRQNWGAAAPEARAERGAPSPRAGGSASIGGADARRRSDAYEREAPSDDEGRSTGRLGTEYGETTWSPVEEVRFERRSASRPDAVVTLRYDDARGLANRGIDVYPHPWWPDPSPPEPEAFPGSRFAPPPP